MGTSRKNLPETNQVVKSEERNNCFDCIHHEAIPGDCHISCSKPLPQMTIGAGGQERYGLSVKFARENHCVVRCIWPGSGIYPFCFDANTIFGCDNFAKAGK